jgi:hypothetical protein
MKEVNQQLKNSTGAERDYLHKEEQSLLDKELSLHNVKQSLRYKELRLLPDYQRDTSAITAGTCFQSISTGGRKLQAVFIQQSALTFVASKGDACTTDMLVQWNKREKTQQADADL